GVNVVESRVPDGPTGRPIENEEDDVRGARRLSPDVLSQLLDGDRSLTGEHEVGDLVVQYPRRHDGRVLGRERPGGRAISGKEDARIRSVSHRPLLMASGRPAPPEAPPGARPRSRIRSPPPPAPSPRRTPPRPPSPPRRRERSRRYARRERRGPA